MKTTFGEIEEGQRFDTRHSKRMMTCVKVGFTKLPDNTGANAVILLEHRGGPAEDCGTLLYFGNDEEVWRV